MQLDLAKTSHNFLLAKVTYLTLENLVAIVTYTVTFKNKNYFKI